MDGFSSGFSSGDSDSPDVQATPFVINRPEGRDKQKKKNRGTPYSSSESWEKNMANMVDNSNTHTRLALAREERGIQREAREKNTHDMMVMNKDLSQMSPQSRAWYQSKKDNIVASYQNDLDM
ncbi:unnamed protein product [Linum tenue]|uniref:No apical meristem-associated C-terminal domain-containing protein n=1 Tax=Linum tenue TaxID=586396 RepID=A0AAV0LM62_9ROSI|nr:unnamed protein product [Linum tenue]